MKAKILRSDTDTVVIVYEDKTGIAATSIPVEMLPDISDDDGAFEVANEVVAAGMPYGFSKKELIAWFPFDRILQKLRAAGIWSFDDIVNNPDLVVRIVSAKTAEACHE